MAGDLVVDEFVRKVKEVGVVDSFVTLTNGPGAKNIHSPYHTDRFAYVYQHKPSGARETVTKLVHGHIIMIFHTACETEHGLGCKIKNIYYNYKKKN